MTIPRRDPLHLLREADPARRFDLEDIDPSAHDTLRAAIPIIQRRDQPKSRRWPRLAAAGVVVVALAGASYGVIAPRLGETDGTNCYIDGGILHISSLTGDPVTDCAQQWRRSGKNPPTDLVAFRDDGGAVGVTARGQVPPDSDLIPAGTAQDGSLIELNSSLQDIVDGPEGRCTPGADAAAYARTELDRLGHRDWTVGRDDDATCAALVIGPDSQTVSVIPSSLHVGEPDGTARRQAELSTALRVSVSQGCLNAGEAQGAVKKILTDSDIPSSAYRITTVAVDRTQCTRIDVIAGGIYDVRLYTPSR